MIFLSSSYEFNRVKLDKATTLMLYVLRLIYEEEREKLSLSRDIFTTTGDLVHKMLSLGVIKRKPANLTLRIPADPQPVPDCGKGGRPLGKTRTPGF